MHAIIMQQAEPSSTGSYKVSRGCVLIQAHEHAGSPGVQVAMAGIAAIF